METSRGATRCTNTLYMFSCYASAYKIVSVRIEYYVAAHRKWLPSCAPKLRALIYASSVHITPHCLPYLLLNHARAQILLNGENHPKSHLRAPALELLARIRGDNRLTIMDNSKRPAVQQAYETKAGFCWWYRHTSVVKQRSRDVDIGVEKKS